MNTYIDDLLFLSPTDAQKLLDEQDPGYTIKFEKNGAISIYNEVGDIEARIQGNF